MLTYTDLLYKNKKAFTQHHTELRLARFTLITNRTAHHLQAMHNDACCQ